MTKSQESKQQKTFDLEERTTKFGREVIQLCKKVKRNPINDRLVSQVVRSAGSVGANYREANDALGKKDFAHRLKISRKECKETLHWFELLQEANPQLEMEIETLSREGTELRNILSAIIKKAPL